MNSETKFFSGIILGTFAVILAAAIFLSGGQSKTPATVAPEILVKSNSQVLGAMDSKVTLVEFSDFQCPACKDAQPAVEAVINKYKDKIRFVYREYPLSSHQYGMVAAQAAEAAGMQGKFWEMHNKLFENQPDPLKSETNDNFKPEKLREYAGQIGLDLNKFDKDYNSDAVRQKILDDQVDGNKAGIRGTPTFFINGVRLNGPYALDAFSKEIDSKL